LYNGQDVRTNEYLITHNYGDAQPNPALLAHNRELLRQMTFYATGNECLRRRLLEYFGEEPPAYCGHCSVCLAEREDIDVSLEARMIISCVYRLKQRGRSFGKTMIIDILRGSRNEKIVRFGLESLSVWGIMAGTNPRRIRAILDFLIDRSFLISEGGEYPVVVLGSGYDNVLNEQERIVMKLPKSDNREKITDNREKRKAKKEQLAISSEQLAMSKAKERLPSAGLPVETCLPGQAGVDKALFEKLRELRKEVAVKEGIPAYMVFSDASLRDMCRKKPASLVQFSAVNGVGSVKLEKYGETFVRAIKQITGNR
jgi:ATP-dependent DNA helicase RecQ